MVDDFFTKGKEGIRKLISQYNAKNPNDRVDTVNTSPQDIAKVIRSIGVDKLPSNDDVRRRILQDPRSGMGRGASGTGTVPFSSLAR